MKKIVYLLLLLALFACSKAPKLEGVEYQLVANPAVTITFDGNDNRFYGAAPINRYFGTYNKDGNNLTLNSVATTMMGGPQKQMEEEFAFLKLLPLVTS